MSTEPSRNPLPFEPQKKRKKIAQTQQETAPNKTAPNKDKPATVAKKKSTTAVKKSTTKESMQIPDAVSNRMIRRMVVLCGIPTVLGISIFVVSYFLFHNMGIKLPNPAVLFASLGCWGLGVLGLSYGVLSASWEEDNPGTVLGWQEFRINLERMTSAWRAARQEAKQKN
ncbi:PAM68 family protein [Limnofasciculus baicalensis]|uniref:PAM68 family protein n=1 Tax=Limnofasciculus baicalensis BBK-W-15 TaxID=2699891 RepID=A0AAE3KNX5_9CYAN|nr:PAM68 family protein [Limnofasciculus baicalensis]MCP2729118.1 PAM68 family protein [Limnofasciculus baicalensis BBK-W-15]